MQASFILSMNGSIELSQYGCVVDVYQTDAGPFNFRSTLPRCTKLIRYLLTKAISGREYNAYIDKQIEKAKKFLALRSLGWLATPRKSPRQWGGSLPSPSFIHDASLFLGSKDPLSAIGPRGHRLKGCRKERNPNAIPTQPLNS